MADPTALRDALARAAPGLRVLACGVLAEHRRIDLVAADADGRVHAVMAAAPGEDEAALTRALAAAAWLEPRLADWLQIAPQLGIDPEAPVRAAVLAPGGDVCPETRIAVRALGPGHALLLEPPASLAAAPPIAPVPPARCDGDGDRGEPAARAAAARASRFRTRLRDADLGPAARAPDAPSGPR